MPFFIPLQSISVTLCSLWKNSLMIILINIALLTLLMLRSNSSSLRQVFIVRTILLFIIRVYVFLI